MHRVVRALMGVVVCVLLGSDGWAQNTAQINGTVTDDSGGVLPGVTVVAVNTNTGFRREVVSADDGAYTLTNLPIGPYRIEASLSGFRSFAQTGIVLQVGANPIIPVKLGLGELTETVTVEAAAPLVETRNPSVGTVIDNEAVEALPLEGRNVASLIVLSGGAVDTGNPSSRSLTQSRGIAVAGGQQFGIAYLLDGALHNNWYDGVNLPLPFPDAMQEFRVETSAQNAQNGIKAGGTVTIATKAGTNQFRGSLFEFARHNRFNATSPLAGINPATGKRFTDGLVRNQFGGVLGGPLVKDKMFFFAAYQGTRATQIPADIVTFVPTAAMLAGDFSAVTAFGPGTCRPTATSRLQLNAAVGFDANNQIGPALLSPAAVRIARLLPTTPDPCGRIAYSRPTKPREGQPIGRLDWQLTQNHSIFARYQLSTTFWDPAFLNANGNVLSATLGGRDNAQHSFAFGDSMVLSNTVVNNFRVSVNRTSVLRSHADLFGPEDVGVNMFSYIPNYMNLTITGAFSINTGTETRSFYNTNTYGISDDLTMVRGDHQFAFGGALAFSDWNTESNVRSMGPMSFNGSATNLPIADFLTGRVFEFRQSSPFVQRIKQPYVAFYGQDTWRLSPKVTLNYGARWEPWFPQNAQDKAVYNFDIARLRAGTRSTVYPQAPAGLYYPGDQGFPGNSGMRTIWSNIAPRVGLSWDPGGNGRASLRAGYGLTADFVTGQFFFDSRSAPPFGLEQRFQGTRLDDPWGAVGRTNPFPVDVGGANYPYNQALYSLFISVPYDLKTTRNHSWNLAFQQQLGDNLAYSATYLGNRLVNLWGDVGGNPGVVPAGVTNPAGPCTLALPGGGSQTFANCSAANTLDLRRELSILNPNVGQYYGYLDWVTDAGWQSYHGLLLSVQRRSAGGLTTSANYTVSTCEGLISQGQAPLNVGTGYQRPVSLINPPSEAEAKAIFEDDRGRCGPWRKHIFNATASVESPQFDGAAKRALLSGWRLSGIFRASSGTPLTVVTGVDRALSGTQVTTLRANQVGSDPYGVNNGGWLSSGSRWLNPTSFAQPALGTYGTSVRNAYDGPGQKAIDLSLVRSFLFGSGKRIEARVEAFNALNWLQLGNPENRLSAANFGQITTLSGDPRVMQFAMKYEF
jgi:hypothetical protein